jgi:hypothetical protein
MKTITLVSGKLRTIQVLTCAQVEKVQLALLELRKETDPLVVEIGQRRAGASLCADALSSAAGKTITVDEVLSDLTEVELQDMVTQVRNYNGVTVTVGEATAAGSTLPTSTVA